MDKQQWQEVRENGFRPPQGASVPVLTEELLSYVGSTDPELRDTIAYEVFANWLEQGQFTGEQLRAYTLRLIANLQEGLGERDTDAVFLRSFSALFLAEIVQYDNQHPFADEDELQRALARALEYLESEQDARGYVDGKGWAHALAHTADWLYVLGQSRHLGRAELAALLAAVRAKLIRPAGWVYIHGEDDRLVRAVMAVFQRNLLDAGDLRTWLTSFDMPEQGSWKGSFEQESLQRSYFNTRTFLRSLYVKANQSDDLVHKDELVPAILDALQSIRQF